MIRKGSALTVDQWLVAIGNYLNMPLARIALFVVFFWFGALKVVGLSPANALVAALLQMTLPWWGFSSFIVVFGLFEMLIGILFLWPRTWKLAFFLLALHMVTTFMPLVLLPDVVWQAPFAPTLEGQYIIKNLVIIALAFSVISHLHPVHKKASGRREK